MPSLLPSSLSVPYNGQVSLWPSMLISTSGSHMHNPAFGGRDAGRERIKKHLRIVLSNGYAF